MKTLPSGGLRLPAGAGLARMLIERNLRAARHGWVTLMSGFFEPVFYLFSMGVGVGSMVGTIETGAGPVPYAAWVAPALMATSSMNGAVYDSVFNIFAKLHYVKLYDSVLATTMGARDVALGEIGWALLRGLAYSTLFYLVLVLAGLSGSWHSVLAVPLSSLVGFAFAGVGMAAATYMRSWQHTEYVQLALIPLYLFSATFYPLTTYPPLLRHVVAATPLYQGVAMLREVMLGQIGWALLGHISYLAILGLAGMLVASRRLESLMYR
jgi:lipooligosaccharide transport system permease protein